MAHCGTQIAVTIALVCAVVQLIIADGNKQPQRICHQAINRFGILEELTMKVGLSAYKVFESQG
jgi:hypothetical protein